MIDEDRPSKITILFVVICKDQFAAVLLHQLFDAFQSDNFFERDVDGISPRLCTQGAYGLISQFRVQSNEGQGYGHIHAFLYTY